MPSPTSSPVVASSVAAPPAPSSDRISVTPTDVAGVRIGTSADEAEQQLTRRLGRPDTDPLPGCYGESGRFLTWDALTVYLSDRAGGGPVVLSGWTVESGPGSQRIALPYETAIGERTDVVMNKVPSSEGGVAPEGPYAESFIISTTKAVGLFWRADAEGAEVDEASYNPEGCD